ncbi:MAG: exonuclease SbcCD subunit D [Acidobacteriota bacterium]
MRIVHTSDWHAGKAWKGKKRLPELQAVLDGLVTFIEEEAVDLLVMSGDVFDTGAPSAEAEQVVFRFFKRLGGIGVPSVVIAGNHDSPRRFDAWGILTELVDCHVVSTPQPAGQGGTLDLKLASGERVIVAAIPFANVRSLVAAEELVSDDQRARGTYGDQMLRLFEQAAAAFRPDAVNLLTAHTFVEGSVVSGSERKVHVGREWAMRATLLPRAHYVALGHVHKPQDVRGFGCPATYAGSPLQLDFGEVGEEKSFVVIDAEAGGEASVRRVAYEGGRPLVDIRATFEELEADVERLRAAGWLRVTVPAAEPASSLDADVNSKVRRLLPNAVVVKVEMPVIETATDSPAPSPYTTPSELYLGYLERQDERTAEPALLELFQRLYDQVASGRAES